MNKNILQNKIYDIIQGYEGSLSDGFEYYGGDDAVKQLAADIAEVVLELIESEAENE